MRKKPRNIDTDLGTLLSEFNRSLMLIVDRSLLIGNFIAKVKTIIPVDDIYVFLLEEATGQYKLQNADPEKEITLSGKDKLIKWLSVNEKGLALSLHPDIVEYFSAEERTILRELNTELIYPLKVMNQISGTIFLGKKTDGSSFSGQEISLLSLLFDQAAFAIEHASIYEIQHDRIKRMYRTDRLAVLGEVAAGAAHEIRNPLTSIRSTIQYISKDMRNDPVKSEMMTELISEVERINKIVQGLLSFARPSDPEISEVDIDDLIRHTLLLINPNLAKEDIEVLFTSSTEDTMIKADKEQLKQVFLNIILNAVEAMRDNGPDRARTLKINIEKGSLIDTRSHFLIISLENTGPGIPESNIENVFNPFFTTKEEGTGLGLAISYGIINRHGGDIEIQSSQEKGTKFTVKLPQVK